MNARSRSRRLVTERQADLSSWVVPEDDPGWPISWRTFLWALVPSLGLYRQRQGAERGDIDGLVVLRQLFVSFCLTIVAVGVVLAVLYPGSEPPADPPTGAVVALLLVGALSSVVGPRVERPLDCEDDAKLAESYRKRFFLRLAFSEVAALLGFVGFFLIYAWWPYVIGAAITALGFRRAAPTSARLAMDQDALAAQGCQRSLISALRQAPPTRPNRG